MKFILHPSSFILHPSPFTLHPSPFPSMSSIDQLFQSLRSNGRKALMPFITAGDPDLDFTAAVLQKLVSVGCPICELGIPYSDPIADGPVIQASYTRALDKKIKLAEILSMLKTATPALRVPVVTMVSYSIVYRHGLEKYVTEAKAAGVAGAIVPDLPVEESRSLADICRREDFSLIQLITPTTPRERAVKIAAASTGFIYYVSIAGITGERRELPPELKTYWLPIHVTLAFLGNAVFALAFGVSLMYLLQESYLKRKKMTSVMKRFPSLEALDKLNYVLLVWGFPLMTLGILTGSLWAGIHWGNYWSWEPRQISSGIVWIFYGIILHGRITAGLRGKKAALLTMAGFVVVIGYFLLGDSIFPSRHGGRFE
jgi:tryptophan synthase alpha chain